MIARDAGIVRGLVMLGLASGLGACTIATPIRYQHDLSAESLATETVIVSLTEATIRDERGARRLFWEHVAAVEHSFTKQAGLLAHAKQREVFGNKAWTMTVWRDEDSLHAFAENDEHRTAVKLSHRVLEDARFVRIEARGDALPAIWRDALDHFADSNERPSS